MVAALGEHVLVAAAPDDVAWVLDVLARLHWRVRVQSQQAPINSALTILISLITSRENLPL
jgi:hypothetical protein